ncbi:outer membrane protein [Desulfobulbus elongatus]|uniref:outer membrane protein n=1 Tax=Desulfobulbus elongatus TaxID=53332 RepID=UPI0004877690|nr:outer membrane beta-barrel protein [Desulfobulbus elongatus]
MKKVLSVMAASAFVLTAGVAFAGGPGKMAPGCPDACQKQIDDLQSSQAQQNEQLSAHGKQLQNHEGRITELEKAFADYWYVRLGVRAAWMQQDVGLANEVDTDAGFGGSIAFGREFSMYQALGKFRAEVELSKQGADLDDTITIFGNQSGDVDLTTVFLNGYYELPIYDAFSMYFMAGVGYAKYDVDIELDGFHEPFLSGSDNVFAYKAGVGMTYNFTDEIAGDLGYEYLGVADTDLADSINGHNVVASVRFKF